MFRHLRYGDPQERHLSAEKNNWDNHNVNISDYNINQTIFSSV